MISLTPALKAKIMSRCVECGGCLLWQGACADGTSPQIRVGGKTYTIRRLIWSDRNGEIAPGIQIAVTCGSQRCLKHLAAMTHSQILASRAGAGCFDRNPEVHGRRIAAAKRARSSVSEADAQIIRSSSERATVLCERYGLSHSYTAAIKRGDKRKDHSSPFSGLFSGLGARAKDESQHA